MRGAARRGRDLTPAVADHPADKSARPRIVTRVTPERAQKEPDVLAKGIELVPERLARAEQVPAYLAVELEHERRLGFFVGVIGREEIGEQLVVVVNRIDRFAQEPGLATESPDRGAIGH